MLSRRVLGGSSTQSSVPEAHLALRDEAFNFSPGSRVAVMEIVDKIRELMNCGHIEAKTLNQVNGEILKQYLFSERAKQMLGWKVTYSLEEGLRETIDWYSRFLRGECG
jgi:CDP-glucose 4,6-dehydratase